MPWKGIKNPYLIWLSEIVLQQTRVKQGLPYFLKFREKYPTVHHLAKANEHEVLRLWQGLGYYSRARNLHATAKFVSENLNGIFPKNFAELRKLKGVGDYTAAAIASFAFGERKAVVDGNVIRVLSRVFGIKTPFDTTDGKKQFAKLANELIDGKNPATYNQAIMDFGSLVCIPKNPKCSECPFKKICVAKNKNLIEQLPYKERKTEIKERHFNYLLIRSGKEIFIQQRTANNIWKNLYELPLIETQKPLRKNLHQAISKFIGIENFEIAKTKNVSQSLSHRKIHFQFVEISLEKNHKFQIPNSKLIPTKNLPSLAFPRTIHLFLRENSLL